jgi:glycine cleavage system aminomethyltransferase T
MGPSSEVRGLYVAAGFNSTGILSSGGAGKVMAEWLTEGLPPVSMGALHAQRALPFQANTRYVRERVAESIGMHMTLHWPGHHMHTARGVRHFPLHDRLLAKGAVMGERIGWEFPLYFADVGAAIPDEPSLKKQAWFPYVERECLAARDAALLIDQSCYGKLRVRGPDALLALESASANKIDVSVGQSVYTHWLNRRGGIEADVTVTRMAEDEFLVITGHPSQVRDRAWLESSFDSAWRVQVHDDTAGLAMFSLSGPKAREILATLTEEDVSNEALPFGHARLLDVGLARCWVLRRSFVGELGYEFYPTTDVARHVFEEILRAGEAHGMRLGGFLAMNHCRLEKGFVHFSHDIGEDDTPLDAGLKFAVAFDKPVAFTGRDVVLQQRDAGTLPARLVNARVPNANLDDGPYLYRNEPIWQGDALVGYVTSGAWGFRLGGSYAMASVKRDAGVTADWLKQGGFEVEVAGVRHPIELQFAGYYDPKSERMRG